MTLPVIVKLGAPDYGRLHGIEGIVFHSPENADPSLQAAIGTVEWQATSGNSSGGSYHGILGHDASRGPMSDPDAWVLVKSVPFTDIAGSISTRRDSIWAPERYPILREHLSDAAYADPNAYLHALCFGGRADWWTQKLSTDAGYAEVRGAFIAMARWVKKLEADFNYDAFINLHRMWQTNRSDPGPLRMRDLILDEYHKLSAEPAPAPAPEPEEDPAVIAELQAEVAEWKDKAQKHWRWFVNARDERDEALAALQEATANDTADAATISSLRGRLNGIKKKVAANAADIADD